jgi:high affinity Mn2+ porin
MNKKIRMRVMTALLALPPLFCFQTAAVAQMPEQIESVKETPAPPADESPDSMLPHFGDASRFWVSGQINVIFQTHPSFHADYSGTNSFGPNYEKGTSRIYTLYTGLRLNHSTEVLVDIEEASGQGMSNSLGLAGYTNLDVVRIPGEGSPLSIAPYFARAEVHEVIALSHKKVEGDRGPMSTFAELPERRVEIHAGLLDTVDFFDQNSVGSDSHFQFMNWATAQNGAYDYAADTRGYTWGVVTEYQAKDYAFRAGDMLEPKVANGIDMEWNLRKAHAENFEFELRKGILPKKDGTIRLLSYINHANMGIYRNAVAQYKAGITPVPEITNHPFNTTIKYGFGVNIEQAITVNFKAYARWGWNNGKTESWAFTEIDSTFAIGLGANGHQWHRNKDRAGVAFVSNAISKDHQNYLADGGLGFLLGDGALNYGREQIVESYYTAHVWRGIYAGPDLQHVNNPGYNRDRGPVLIPGFRVHVEL